VPIAAVQHSNGGPVKTLGMVLDRQTTSKGGVIFGLEDQSGSVKVLCSPDRVPLDIVTDEVVGVIGALSKDRSIIYADSIVRPDIPLRRSGHRADRDLHVAFASDMHVGSVTFLHSEWDRFMDFLNGRLETSNGILDTLEYLIIPGDLVDGIGIYPNQREELLIPDIYRQYEAMAELLKDVPDRIRVVLMPGNHDMVRQAEPQPALPKEVQDYFSGRVTFLGNPAMLGIEGVRILAYHGRSIDDYVTAVQACTYEQPLVTMKEMLRRRHLAPVYGGRTPIAPEASDHLVVETIPDVFVTGHVHGTGVEAYRGSLLINASAWQSQTKYQKSMNFVPDPAKVPIVNLKDMSVKVMDFAA
jgi:DNA polymerase II small subunit